MRKQITPYIKGYVLSLYCTLVAYLLVEHRSLGKTGLIAAVSLLALIQFFVQARYFLHLSARDASRSKRMVFYFMLGVVIIVVAGSIWIMQNLNYHMRTPAEMRTYLRTEEGL